MRSIEEIIARNILLKLDELNMTQDQLAKGAKLSRQTINRIVKKQQESIRASTRQAIAKALNTTKEELERDYQRSRTTETSQERLLIQNRALEDRIIKLEKSIEGIPAKLLRLLKQADQDKRKQVLTILEGGHLSSLKRSKNSAKAPKSS